MKIYNVRKTTHGTNDVAIEEFMMSCGSQSIKKIPKANRFTILYNDRREMPFAHPQFQWRRPVAVAVGDDDCSTWKYHGLLEPENTPNNCYYSIGFTGEDVVFSCYEGNMEVDDNGTFLPNNLTSLKYRSC